MTAHCRYISEGYASVSVSVSNLFPYTGFYHFISCCAYITFFQPTYYLLILCKEQMRKLIHRSGIGFILYLCIVSHQFGVLHTGSYVYFSIYFLQVVDWEYALNKHTVEEEYKGIVVVLILADSELIFGVRSLLYSLLNVVLYKQFVPFVNYHFSFHPVSSTSVSKLIQ